MKYKRCILCEINYVEGSEEICKICKSRSSVDDGRDLEIDICPFCEKNRLEYGEERCKSCQRKANFVAKFDENL